MLRGEILPALPLAEQLSQLVVADSAAAFGGANTGLLQGGGCCAGDITIDDASATKPEFVGAQKRIDDPGIRRRDRGASEEDPARGARVEPRRLTHRREEDHGFDPGRSGADAATAEGVLTPENGSEALGLAVGEGQRVVDLDRAALGNPFPAGSISLDRARA
jgi:hypothetical protein